MEKETLLETPTTIDTFKSGLLSEIKDVSQEIQALDRKRHEYEHTLLQNVQISGQLENSLNELHSGTAKYSLHVEILQHQLELQKAIVFLQRESYRLQMKPQKNSLQAPQIPITKNSQILKTKSMNTTSLVQPKPFKFKRELESIASAGEIDQLDPPIQKVPISVPVLTVNNNPPTLLFKTPMPVPVKRITRQSIAVSNPTRYPAPTPVPRVLVEKKNQPSEVNLTKNWYRKSIPGPTPAQTQARRRVSMMYQHSNQPPPLLSQRNNRRLMTPSHNPRLVMQNQNIQRDRFF